MAKKKPSLIIKLTEEQRDQLTKGRVIKKLTYKQLTIRSRIATVRIRALEAGATHPSLSELVRWAAPLGLRIAASDVAIVKRS